MNHLKLFESIGDVLWIVVYERLEDASSNYQKIFYDRESAENYYIELTNDLKMSEIKNRKEFITTVDEADEWVKDNDYEYRIECKEIIVSGKYELPEKIRKARIAKKYRLK